MTAARGSYESPFAAMGDRVMLERLQVAACMELSPSVAASVSLDTTTDMLTGNLIARICAYVQAQRLVTDTATESREVVVETPATTWQMFKATHASSWWLGWLVHRRPVRLTAHRREVTLTATWVGYATFPDSTIVLDDKRLGSPVFQVMKSTAWRER